MSEEGSTLFDTSSLLSRSKFHPLSATQGEESVRKIVSSSPSPFHYEAQKLHQQIEKEHHDRMRLIFQRTTNASEYTKEEIFRVLKGKISKDL